MSSWKVPLFDLRLGPEEKEAVMRVLDRAWLTSGPETRAFEQEFSSFIGTGDAVFLSSGTAALHLALVAIDVGPGDEVIVPSFTFVATAAPVLWQGARLVFADSHSLENPNISRETVEPLITPRTKAVIFVHYAGFSQGIREMAQMCQEHGISLIEDAAHTHGSISQGKKPGTFGRIGCFSFFSNKNMTSGEGGALVSQDLEIVKKVRVLASHGRTASAWDRFTDVRLKTYDVVELGYNYRATDMQAGLARAQLAKLPHMNALRLELVKRYRQALADVPGLILPFDDYQNSANYIFPVVLPQGVDRLRVMSRLAEAGIQSSVHYPAIHTFSYYKKLFPDLRLETAETLGQRELSLPLFPHMSQQQQELVIKEFKKALSRLM